MTVENCPFCDPAPDRILRTSPQAIALTDGFPVSDGHALVVPRQHVASVFDLAPEIQHEIWTLVAEIRIELATRLQPDGFNIGVNDGAAAGQTVMHAHVHVVPRFRGDVDDPRGGVRWVIPQRAAYWRGDDS